MGEEEESFGEGVLEATFDKGERGDAAVVHPLFVRGFVECDKSSSLNIVERSRWGGGGGERKGVSSQALDDPPTLNRTRQLFDEGDEERDQGGRKTYSEPTKAPRMAVLLAQRARRARPHMSAKHERHHQSIKQRQRKEGGGGGSDFEN